ncbi:phosphoesterase, partial [Bifidobacterium longum]
AQYTDAGNHPASDSSAGENSAIAAGPDLATLHAAQRPALISVAIGTAVIAIVGGIWTVRRKSKNQLQQ